MNLLCLIGLHNWKKYFTGNKVDTITYLECRRCKKRKYRDSVKHRIVRPLDEEWLSGNSSTPNYPKKPIVK